METIKYYFNTPTENKRLKKLISQQLFHEVVAYFRQTKGEIILRDIKKHFDGLETLDALIDEMIDLSLLERKNRRYRLLFPIYTDAPAIKKGALDSPIFSDFSTLLDSQQKRLFFLGEWLWSKCAEDPEKSFFFGVMGEKTLPFYIKKEIGNNKLEMVSVRLESSEPYDLVNYFDQLSEKNEISSAFQPLIALMGDVEVDYFLTQANRVLKSVKKGRTYGTKRNIFQEVLLETGIIQLKEGEMKLAAPVISSELFLADEIILDQLSFDLKTVWQEAADYNEEVFRKKNIYGQIFKKINAEKDSIFYFKE